MIEVVLSMGVVSFAMVGILGLVPVGLSNFRDAMNLTAEAQIIQNVSSDILRTDYKNLVSFTSYYDEQGNYLPAGKADASYLFSATVTPVDLTPSHIPGGQAENYAIGKTISIDIQNRTSTAQRKYTILVPKE
jgi:uncharacterized protein (TIGR02598 family)